MITRLDTLGGLRIYRNGEELASLPGRPMQCALLAYLAVERTATRDSVMAVLWPEKDTEKARGSLNTTAYELRRALGDDWVTAQGDLLRVGQDIETDLQLLEVAVDEGRLADAVALAQGAFLEGMHLARSPEFENWVDRQSARAQQLERRAHRGVLQESSERGAAAAIAAARAWVHRSPHDDEAHYWLIRHLAEGGQRAEALKVYEHFSRSLHDAYDVDPDETLQDLVSQIRAGEFSGLRAPLDDNAKAVVEASLPDLGRDGQTPSEVWRPYPGLGKKLLKSLGFYLVPAIGGLELLGTLIENSALPQELFQPALALVLLGIPIVAATAFLQSQPVDQWAQGGIRLWIARWFTWRNTMLGGLAAVAAFATAVVVLPRNVPSWDRVPSVVLVLPFQLEGDDEHQGLAVELAGAVTEILRSWEPARVPSDIVVTGARLELGLADPTLRRGSEGVRIGREVGADAVIALTATPQGDSVSMEATLYDAASGLPALESVFGRGEREHPIGTVAPVLAHVLGFGDAPDPAAAFGAGTRSPAAAVAYLQGRQELKRNRRDVAEASFARAVELDSTFATAMTFLAQTIYWRDGEYTERGSEVSRWSTAAMGQREGLSWPNAQHVRGFYAFQLGDYPTARERYEEILQADPRDVNAFVMVGQIEWHDPWMTVADDGSAKPHSNLNRAWEAYLEAVRVDPTYEPAYGRLIEVQNRVERAIDPGACPAFDVARGESRPPFQRWTPSFGARAFCPAVLDSIVWLTRTELEEDRARAEAGADRLSRETERALERWASFSPGRPQPLEQRAQLLLARRARFEVADPGRLQEIAREALRYTSGALALQADTTDRQLARLASLYLAAGDLETAKIVASELLDRYDGEALHLAPQLLMNVLVTGGQADSALEIASGAPFDRLIQHPDTDEFIDYAGAEPIVERIRILGAVGLAGPLLDAELERLSDTWAGAGYSVQWQQLLRNHVTIHIATGLVTDPEAMARWAADSGAESPLWLGLTTADTTPERALGYLEAARVDDEAGLGSSTQAFLLGALAGKLGRHSEAIRHYARLDSIPHSVRGFDAGWGLQSLSLLRRAEHFEQLGDPGQAREHLRRFQEARLWPGSLPTTAAGS